MFRKTNKQTSARDEKRTASVYEKDLEFFIDGFLQSGFLDYEDGESGGEILRWVAEKFDRGGDLETEREVLSVGGF